jgi:hypothetical protein
MHVEVKLIFSCPAEAAAFLAADPVDIRFAVAKPAAVAALTSPSVTDEFPEPGMEAPGKPSAAPTARSPRTAAAAPSTPAPSAAAPAPAPTATPPAAPAPSASAPAEAFDYAALAKAVNARVARYGKAALLAIATKHGAGTFKGLPASAWAAAHADVVALGD